ncbi:DsbA family protein [Streptomyces sp. HB2AG]|uniref:DsbA family protein n=1 Tax=Streptomyces sp. HB2AG TaxID=2983400 RepID=UPI0022AA8811|nr:thioredoxin domain-containing protein [Streptomyces sp. HB2AG]MCZ2528167.1 thioredoxin domain-containing protein [Streptomyces sp. HB2AG]
MSQKNRDGKRGARERLQEQRQQEAARAKRRRTLVAAAVVAGVLAVAAAVGVVVANTGGEDEGPVASPKGAGGENGLVLSKGRADAPATLTVYEDFRCPACKQFEDTYRSTIDSLVKSGDLRVDYHLVTIIDGNVGGQGSTRAANAAACSQDAGHFPEYHDVLFANQPPETEDAFADNGRLLKLAGKVDGLRSGAFDSCVEKGTYEDWVARSSSTLTGDGYNSTPTVLLDGKDVYSGGRLTPESLKKQVEDAARS